MKFAPSLILTVALLGGIAAECASADTVAAETPTRQGGFTILCSPKTLRKPAWRNVVLALQAKHRNAGRNVIVQEVNDWSEDELARCLKQGGARYAGIVARPEEVNRVLVMNLHRAARRMDADPWGDCLWGIITGATPEDALRVATASKPLVMKRLLSTTNADASRFEHSYCITDWTGAPILEQSGYSEPKQTLYNPKTPEGKAALETGLQALFAEQLETARPQMIVTASHATQFNLEMPFGCGLIIPSDGLFYQAAPRHLFAYKPVLKAALAGDRETHRRWVKEHCLKPVEADGEPRIWLAAGNCLFGDAYGCADSMAVTALSTYTCNQIVGYTVTTWYGEGGWGTMGSLLNNAEGTSLAEAWFLNNQFILHRTQKIDPALLGIEFNEEQFSVAAQARMIRSMEKARIAPEKVAPVMKDCFGLIHDRDVVAFYGDPTWRAVVNESNTKPAFRISWNGKDSFTISSEKGGKGRVGVLFPESVSADSVISCDAPDAVFTNDFILFESLELAAGSARTVTLQYQK